jgi:hypothetical protein
VADNFFLANFPFFSDLAENSWLVQTVSWTGWPTGVALLGRHLRERLSEKN